MTVPVLWPGTAERISALVEMDHGGYEEMEVDFVLSNPGLPLFHCHQQLQMYFGFMAVFDNIA